MQAWLSFNKENSCEGVSGLGIFLFLCSQVLQNIYYFFYYLNSLLTAFSSLPGVKLLFRSFNWNPSKAKFIQRRKTNDFVLLWSRSQLEA